MRANDLTPDSPIARAGRRIRRGNSWVRVAALTVCLGTAVGCDASPQPSQNPSPTLSVSPTPPATQPRSLTPGELADSARFRTDFGIRADAGWIQTVASRPDANWTSFGVPLDPSEIAELEDRISASDAVAQIISKYGEANPADWAGVYIDHGNGSQVTVLFTANTDAHRAAILHSLSPNAQVAFRTVPFTLAELQREADRLKGADGWFRTLPAVLTGYGVDIQTNTVRIKVSSIDTELDEVIRKEFGWPEGFVTVESDGRGVQLIGRGQLRVRVVNPAGRPVKGAQCIAVSDLTGRDVARVPKSVTDAHGECTIDRLAATGYWVRVQKDTPGPGFLVLGYVRASVSQDATTEVQLTTR